VQVHDLVRNDHHWLADSNTNNKRNNKSSSKGNNKSSSKANNLDLLSNPIWSTQRSGAVHCAALAPTIMDENAARNSDCPLLAFGGYDKTVVLVDTKDWLVVRELSLQGTVRTIIMLGCSERAVQDNISNIFSYNRSALLSLTHEDDMSVLAVVIKRSPSLTRPRMLPLRSFTPPTGSRR
jgi:hypothetical protein